MEPGGLLYGVHKGTPFVYPEVDQSNLYPYTNKTNKQTNKQTNELTRGLSP
jgi:hypothetical protein